MEIKKEGIRRLSLVAGWCMAGLIGLLVILVTRGHIGPLTLGIPTAFGFLLGWGGVRLLAWLVDGFLRNR